MQRRWTRRFGCVRCRRYWSETTRFTKFIHTLNTPLLPNSTNSTNSLLLLCCLNTRNVFLEVHPHSYLETLDCRGGQGSPGKSQPEKGQVCSSKGNGKDTRVRRYHRGKESGEGEEGKLEMVSVLLDANTLFRLYSNTLQIIFETLQNQRCRVSISVRNLRFDFGKGRTGR